MISLVEHLILELSADTYKRAANKAREAGDERAEKFYAEYRKKAIEEIKDRDDLSEFYKDIKTFCVEDEPYIEKIKSLKDKLKCDFTDGAEFFDFKNITFENNPENTSFDVTVNFMSLDGEKCFDRPAYFTDTEEYDSLVKYLRKLAEGGGFKYNDANPHLNVHVYGKDKGNKYSLTVNYFIKENIAVVSYNTFKKFSLSTEYALMLADDVIKSVNKSFKLGNLKWA